MFEYMYVYSIPWGQSYSSQEKMGHLPSIKNIITYRVSDGYWGMPYLVHKAVDTIHVGENITLGWLLGSTHTHTHRDGITMVSSLPIYLWCACVHVCVCARVC